MTATIYCFVRVSFLLQSVHQQIRIDQKKLKKEKPFKIGGRLGVQPYVKAMKNMFKPRNPRLELVNEAV